MALVVGLIINGHCNEPKPLQKMKALELKWEVNGGDNGDGGKGGWRLSNLTQPNPPPPPPPQTLYPNLSLPRVIIPEILPTSGLSGVDGLNIYMCIYIFIEVDLNERDGN